MNNQVNPGLRYLRILIWALLIFVAIFTTGLILELTTAIEIPNAYSKMLSILFHVLLMWVLWRNYKHFNERQSIQHDHFISKYYSLLRAGAPDDMNPYKELAKESIRFRKTMRIFHSVSYTHLTLPTMAVV